MANTRQNKTGRSTAQQKQPTVGGVLQSVAQGIGKVFQWLTQPKKTVQAVQKQAQTVQKQTAQTQTAPHHPTPVKPAMQQSRTQRPAQSAAIKTPAGYAAQRSGWMDTPQPAGGEDQRRQGYYLEALNETLQPANQTRSVWDTLVQQITAAGGSTLWKEEAAARQKHYMDALTEQLQRSTDAVEARAKENEPTFWDKVKDFFEQVGETMEQGQEWARKNRVSGLSATEAPVEEPQQDSGKQYFDEEMKKAREAAAWGKKMVDHLRKSAKAMEEAQNWAQDSGVAGLSATEAPIPKADTEEFLRQQQAQIDAAVQRAQEDEWTQYIASGAVRPVLEWSDGLNQLMESAFGESDRFTTDNLERLDAYQAGLSPAGTLAGDTLRGATEFLTRVGLAYLLGPVDTGLGIAADFGSGMKDVRDAGGGLGQQLAGGLKETAKSAAIDALGGKIGRTAAGEIVGWLDGLSLRQQEELMERLAELVGIDAATLIEQWYNNHID